MPDRLVTVTRAAFDTAIVDGKQPVRWEMMIDAYRALQRELEPDTFPPAIFVGVDVQPYLGLPVEIVPGAQKEWRLIAE